MESTDFVFMMSNIIVGGITTFIAVLLWSRTRDVAWILMIVGTIVYYIYIIYNVLDKFGIVGNYSPIIYGIPIVKVVLSNLPLVFFAVAFVVVINRKRFP